MSTLPVHDPTEATKCVTRKELVARTGRVCVTQAIAVLRATFPTALGNPCAEVCVVVSHFGSFRFKASGVIVSDHDFV